MLLLHHPTSSKPAVRLDHASSKPMPEIEVTMSIWFGWHLTGRLYRETARSRQSRGIQLRPSSTTRQTLSSPCWAASGWRRSLSSMVMRMRVFGAQPHVEEGGRLVGCGVAFEDPY